MQSLRVWDKSHHIDFVYTRVRDAGNSCLLFAGKKDAGEARHIRILNSWISGCGTRNKNAEGLYVSHSVDKSKRGGRDIYVKDTVFTGIKGEPVNLKYETRGIILDRILIWKNFATVNNDPGLLSAQLTNLENAGHVLKNSLIIGNRGHKSSENAAIMVGPGWSVFNNIIANNENMHCVRGVKGSIFYANTCYGNELGFYSGAAGQGGKGTPMGEREVLCNIGDDKWNNIRAEKSLFMGADGLDFRLSRGTARMKDGCKMSGELRDILGYQRPESKWDFGAFQYRGGGNDPGPVTPGPVTPDPVDPDSARPNPVNVGWCPCGCAESKVGALDAMPGLELCEGGCAACGDGMNIPVGQGEVIGPVFQ
jgi:hypothetical protein